ncbi:efflux RND transporter periplasmic adaptor subunit [Microbaculum marinum]|uniref:HlyD family efflux transporter periplasmic adaptor subunit n=1 Tax=Microbaculum marinum TaxID=1764581 RepID=A0AAW9RU49_9HYPH
MAIKWVRPVLLGAVAAGAAAAVAWAFWPQPVPVDIAEIVPGTLEVTVDDEGMTRIRDIYSVSAPVSGKVLRSPLEVGDPVTAHDTVVAVIQPTAPEFLDARARRAAEAAALAAESAVALGEAQVAEAESQLTFAQSQMQRSEELARRQIISERAHEQAVMEVDTAKARLASARATLDVRKRELESARARLIGPESPQEAGGGESCCVNVTAPETGEVLKLVTESEQVVPAGTPLVEIGDPHNLEIVVDLLSSDAVRVPSAAQARIDGWGGDTLQARVRRIESAGFTKISALGIEEQRVKAILDLIDPPSAWSGLGHGYRVVVHIVVDRQEALLVPLGALFRRGDSWAVFTVDADHRARRREVVLGARNNRSAAALEGLSEGERVILHPSDRVADGVKVTARETEDL